MLSPGHVSLVTGAALGIGAGIADLFAQHGARVYVLDIDIPKAEAKAAEINAAGGTAHAMKCDVSVRSDVEAVVSDALSRYGQIDSLVNNAGIYPRRMFLETTEADWDRMQAVNVKSLLHTCQLVLPHMIARHSGKIVNISSVTVWIGVEKLVYYVTSKGAVLGLTRSLAREVGRHNVHVNCVTPGAIKTEGEIVHANMDDIRAIQSQQCLDRRILPYDVAAACLFLSSPLSDGMTGQTLNVDGGLYMH
ncbi:MAG TPA: SDR family NAD(P)-dependent oxidoreductase [Terrimicrobiaceae bacterium]|nr:SDR family NAD(P)-dependent oxidoreductase [Terrimicrobiaceae bacterium]